jgi:hypothetical protein
VAVRGMNGLTLAVTVAMHQNGKRSVGLMHPLDFTAMMVVTSSQEARRYLLLPRFCVFLIALGVPVDSNQG